MTPVGEKKKLEKHNSEKEKKASAAPSVNQSHHHPQNSKKPEERKASEAHPLPQKESEKIQMKFQVQDNEVTFDYNLRKDTPEVVAKEFVNEMKFDNPADYHKYFITFKDKITKSLEKYHANKALINK